MEKLNLKVYKGLIKWDGGHIRKLGTPRSIGALKKMIRKYSSETSFGFRNQPMQSLHELRQGDDVFIIFQ